MNTSLLRTCIFSVLLVLPLAAQASYSDIPEDTALRQAVVFLRDGGVLQDAELYNPDNQLTREQAAKVIVAAIVPAEELAKLKSTSFTDVSGWSLPYVEAARIMGIVKTTNEFRPTASITKSEFIKMLLASRNIDFAASFSDLTSPLSSDVTDPGAWYFPVIRYALASSMTAVAVDGKLNPHQEITRGQMALLFFRLEMYLKSLRIQALLSQIEEDIGSLHKMLEENQPDQAGYAAARAVVAARGALQSKPDEALVKGAVKVAEGYQSLFFGYKAGAAGQLDLAIEYAKAAYASADKAEGFSASLASLAGRIRENAKKMADDARALKAQQ